MRGSTSPREQGNRRNPAHAAGIDRAAPTGIDRSRDRMIRDIDRPARARIDPFAARQRPRPARAGIDRTGINAVLRNPPHAGINPSSPNPVARRSKRPRTRGDEPTNRLITRSTARRTHPDQTGIDRFLEHAARMRCISFSRRRGHTRAPGLPRPPFENRGRRRGRPPSSRPSGPTAAIAPRQEHATVPFRYVLRGGV